MPEDFKPVRWKRWDPFATVGNVGDLMRMLSNPIDFPADDFNFKIEVKDKPDKVIVRAELPGISKDDIKVNMEDDYLTISGEKKGRTEDDIASEFYYGTFTRTIHIAPEIDDTKIKASYKDGILDIILPKKQVDKEVKKVGINIE